MDFGKKFIPVSQDQIDIIIHSCKTILLYNNDIWIKKNNSDKFDIPMGSLHGAEACELVGLYLLEQLKDVLNTGEYGIYRDDGLVVYDNSRCKIKRVSKAIRKVFAKNGFKVTIDNGSKKIDFLDVALDLGENSFRPFRKPNSETVYVHSLSNHPNYVKKQIPNNINQRLSQLSKSSREFDLVKNNYQDALAQSEYKFDLKYKKPQDNRTIRKRRRKIIYFQPPFSRNVITPIGKKFLNLVKKHFTPNHPLSKFLNSKCLKLSYCCLPSVKNEITSINKNVRGNINNQANAPPGCNCRGRVKNPNICPLNGACLTEQLVYRADIKSREETKIYIGSTGLSFKNRYTKHKASLTRRKSDVPTTLSTYYWREKDKGNDPIIKWSIVKIVYGKYSQRNGCPLCNRERLEIARINKKNILNKRNELKSNCPHHRNNFFPTKK